MCWSRRTPPSAVNADPGMIAPDGYVYVPVKTGVSDDNYTQIVSGLTGNDTVALRLCRSKYRYVL